MDVYSDECLSCIQVLEWFKNLKREWKKSETTHTLVHPCSSKIDININQNSESVRENHQAVAKESVQ